MDLLDDLDAENVTPGFLRSELTRWVDGEPLRATKPPCKWWEIKQAPRAHRAIGGRAQPTFNLTLTEVRRSRSVLAPGAVPHVYVSLSAPVAPHVRNTSPSQEEVDHDLAAISRAIRGSPAQDTVAPDRARARARATARGNGGPRRAKAKTPATRPDNLADNLKTTSLPSRNLPA